MRKSIKNGMNLKGLTRVPSPALTAGVLGILLSGVFAEERDNLTRIGVITPLLNGADSSLQEKSAQVIKDKLHKIGKYDVYTEKRMRDAIEVFARSYPEYCQEPRCASVLGAELQLDRMIYGRVIENQDRYAVELTMVDCATRKIIDEASIEGDAGVSLEQVVTGAMNRIEGIEDTLLSKSMNRYYGEETDNVVPMLISTGTVTAASAAFALIANDRQDQTREYSDTLSGISADMRSAPKSGRAKALGNCYAALAKDAYGVFYNPAGASWADRAQASVGYRNHFGMVNSMSASFVGKATRELGWGHSFSYSGSPESYYQEIDMGTVVSYKFNELFGKLPPISLGAGLNIASNKTTGGSGSEYDQSGTELGLGVDFGALMELTRKIDFGLVFNNVPFVMFHNNSSATAQTKGRSSETRPAVFKMGATYEVSYGTLLVAEGTLPLYNDQNFRFAGGLEQRLFSIMLLRLGAEKETLQSYDSPWHLTAGFGFDIPVKDRKISLDGAFDFNTSRELLGIWDVSMKVDL